MADVARELLIKLGISFDAQSAARAEKRVEQLKYAAENMSRAFSSKLAVPGGGGVGPSADYVAAPAESMLAKVNALKAGLAGLAAAFAATRIARFVESVADAADQLKANAERIGTTTQALQGLQYAAQLSD